MSSNSNEILNVAENPHVVDEVFESMLKSLLENWLKKSYDVEYWFIRFEYQNRGTIHAHILIKLNDEPSLGEAKGLIELGNVCIAGIEAQD